MDEWLNIVMALSVAGSSIFIISYCITSISREALAARWYYWSRKLALFFFIVPIFLILNVPLLFKKDNQFLQLGRLPIVQQNTISLSEIFVQIVFVAWLIGAIGTGLWFLYMYRGFYQKIHKNFVAVPKEHVVWSILERQRRDKNLKYSVNLAYCRENISPILVGMFKPTIVLPMYAIPDEELTMIINHELTHYKKKDLWIKRAMIVVTMLHWYNPFIYLLHKEITKWCEFSCDEDVVMKLSHSERKKYGETILNMIQRTNQHASSPYSTSFFTTGQMRLKKRLVRILKVKKVSKSSIVIAITLFLVFGSVGIVSSVFAHKNIPSVPEKGNEVIPLEQVDHDKKEVEKSSSEIISVKLSDESRFSKEEWAKILKQIENNEVILEKE
ncbi:M56 family metallopeptidase [Lysinibacillus sp. NPDC097231]|uniref:M56 family metallopeptidase n=1 Tax=Lysinibacillus sp. NPDC097231 TaxID=3364142 RepID=UPI003801BC74